MGVIMSTANTVTEVTSTAAEAISSTVATAAEVTQAVAENAITLNGYYTLILATIVLLFGRFLVKKIRVLATFNIPEPVAGGLVAATFILIFHQFNEVVINIDTDMQTAFMLMFFASIGLSADFSRLKSGGKPLVIFTILVAGFIVLQNFVGLTLSSVLTPDQPLVGIIAGSITLVGGHGTALGWGDTLQTNFGIEGAKAIGIACATFGLVAGGLIGGPVARRLIKKVQTPDPLANNLDDNSPSVIFERPHRTRLITADAAIETLALFALCLAMANGLDSMMAYVKATYYPKSTFVIPTFVWALASGVVVRNVLSSIFSVTIFDRCVDVFGNVCLSLFLAMALVGLKLWDIQGLGVPLIIILSVQTLVMILFAYHITFRVMGANYDAAVLAAGHCGFGMGATPTAVANMQAVTQRFGPSHKAFLIVPLVGAFFVDLLNAAILTGITSLPFWK